MLTSKYRYIKENEILSHVGIVAASQQSVDVHGDCAQDLSDAASTCVAASQVTVEPSTDEHCGVATQQFVQSIAVLHCVLSCSLVMSKTVPLVQLAACRLL